MGMFDTVICPPELLPDRWKPTGYPFGSDPGFQTKAFFREMKSYRITPEGRLEVFLYDQKFTGRWWAWEGNKKVILDQNYKSPAGGLLGPYEEYERVNERWAEVHSADGRPYTGEFNFYASERTDDPDNDKWHEYIAKFVDGQLQEIRDDSERLRELRQKK